MANSGHIITNSGARTRTGTRPEPTTAREWLERRLEARPETAAMDRVKLMTREEKARAGIDGMTRQHVDSLRRQGRDVSESAVRAEVQKVAERVEAKRDRGEM